MTPIDWIIVTLYILSMVGLSLYLGARQKEQSDYYLAGNKLGAWSIAGSMIATQCSAISLIGAPAFIAIKEGGGLKWLQYELAVPLAAIGILYLVGVYKKAGTVTIFSTVENRLGTPARKTLSLLFLSGRGLATGVALYAMSVVVSVCLGISITNSIILVGGLSMLYTSIGGIEADIYSDIIQLIILWLSALACAVILFNLIESPGEALTSFDTQRLTTIEFSGFGLSEGDSYTFWPMLIGGFFLYLAYYGCDQSQAQRLLSARDMATAQKAILLNGCLRFPLVLTYCAFGLLLGLFYQESSWLQERMVGQNPDFIAPYFIIEYMPTGLRGLIVAGILAAAMSSLDSNINSMSAALENDFLKDRKINLPGFSTPLKRARILTVGFGILCCILALLFSDSQATVLVLVNAVSSAFNGPILACFVFVLFARRPSSPKASVAALLAGIAANGALWLGAPQVSWLWWNLVGFVVSFVLLLALSNSNATAREEIERPPLKPVFVLLAVGLIIFCSIIGIEAVL
ncbi:sodium:solute symporter family transporter [Pelagicoccus albus]|uniref:Sodium/solute symporter n=1 Tax=Pelagicoccus albus TaxID=415222 RepID=A0A7X1B305_9BACT|nr:sodium/solute symporter [Pelagicoccus albus]MBC2604449.1 sodium/solute symporter [Pelagicoccus albus]